MTRLLAPRPRSVRGWVDGVVELAEPAPDPAGEPAAGALEAARDLVPTPAGRLAVRGGSRRVQTFHGVGGTPVTAVLAVAPFSQSGLVAVTYHAGEDAHYLTRLTADGAFVTGVEATSRTALGWSGAGVARAQVVEMFEALYVADCRPGTGARYPLVSVDGTGALTATDYDLDGDGATPAAPMRPAGVEHWNSYLFAWGWDSEAAPGGAPHLLRHSFLGRSPARADGWDADAYAIIGEAGKAIVAARGGARALLVAKADGLYRVSGAGAARPGWQFAIEPVDPTARAGVTSPHALTFYEGYWYGVGPQGPFRTDGERVESLLGPRRASWGKVDQLDRAWVGAHPERNLVLFGLHGTDYALVGRSATEPFVCWAWDVAREVWAPDLRFPYDTAGVALALGAVGTAPSAAPLLGAPDHTLATTTAVACTVTPTDATAQLEVWARDGAGGASTLAATYTGLPTSVQTLTVGGFGPNREVFLKFRHTKGGVTSAFTAEAPCVTRLAPPGTALAASPTTSSATLKVTQPAGTVDRVVLTLESDSAPWKTVTIPGPVPAGTTTVTVAGLQGATVYRAHAASEKDAWPAPLTASAAGPTANVITKDPDYRPPGSGL